MKLYNKFLLAALFVGSLSANAQEVTSPGFGKGILNIMAKDSTFSMNLSARFQGLYTSEWTSFYKNKDYISESNAFMIRRARLKFSGFAYSPKLTYKMELGLSNSDISGASIYTDGAPRYILDAVVMWNFHENFTLWAGQAKLPGNRERVISSGNLQFVDRSLLNSRYNIDRDIGLQLRHYFLLGEEIIVREAIAFSQGEGRNITSGNFGGFQYTARAEILPFGLFSKKGDYVGSDLAREQTPKLSIGASYDFNNDAVRTRSNMGSYMVTDNGFHQTNITTFFIDAMFKYKGFSFMGEYAKRDAKDPIARNADGTATGAVVNVGSGLNLQAGYLFKNDFELAGRYTNIDFDKNITGVNTENQYTIGLSKFFAGHKLKVQTDISYTDWANTTNNNILYRLQFDIHF